MATMTTVSTPNMPNRYRANGTVYARNTWDAVQRHGSTAMQATRTFLVNHPAMVQGIYYLLVGLWPVVSIDSFQFITGRKTDVWVVQTVGLLLCVIGASLCLASFRRQRTAEIMTMALGSATVMAAIHLIYALSKKISYVYLLDSGIELGITFLWFYTWYRESVVGTPPAPASAAPISVPLTNGQMPVMPQAPAAPVAGGAMAGAIPGAYPGGVPQ